MDLKQLRIEIAALGDDHEYMSDMQYKLFKQHLNARLKVLQDVLISEKSKFAEMDHSASCPLDKAAITEAEQEIERRIDNAKSESLLIRRAIQAINDEEFGFCKSCGTEIGLPRLLSVPHSIRDAECETMAERKSALNQGVQPYAA